jgi:Flp pilus assembly protein protease CpaA
MAGFLQPTHLLAMTLFTGLIAGIVTISVFAYRARRTHKS